MQVMVDKSQYGRDTSSKNVLFCQDGHYDTKTYPFVKGQNSEAVLPVSTLIQTTDALKGKVVLRIICHMASRQEDGYLARERIP
jgi:hypothetical protein